MLSNSNLRNIDEPTQQQRQERRRKILQKLQDSNIISKNKPFVHAMYQDYHEKFCNILKKKFMVEAQEIIEKKEGKNISKYLHNISEIRQNSEFHKNDMTNILNEFQDEKSQSNQPSSIIVPAEIKQLNFPSQVKTQKTGNQMKKKKIQEIVEVLPPIQKNEPKKKDEIVYHSQIKEKSKKQVEGYKEVKQSPTQVSNTFLHPKQQQEVIKKLEIKSPVQIKQRIQEHFAIKSDKNSPKKQNSQEQPAKSLPSPTKLINPLNIKNKKPEEQEEYYEQVQQDTPSYYQQRLKQIDDVQLSTSSQIQSRPVEKVIREVRSPISHIIGSAKNDLSHFVEIKPISVSQSNSFEKQQHLIKVEQTKQSFDVIQVVPQSTVSQKALIIEQKNQEQQIQKQSKQQKQEKIVEPTEGLQNQILKIKQDAPQQKQDDVFQIITPKQQSNRAESIEKELPKEQISNFDPPSRSYQYEFPFDYTSKLTESAASQSLLEPDSQSQVEIKQAEQQKEKSSSQKESSSSSDSQQEQINKLSLTQKFGSIEYGNKNNNSQISESSLRPQKSNEEVSQAEQENKDNLANRIKRIIDRFVEDLTNESFPHHNH